MLLGTYSEMNGCIQIENWIFQNSRKNALYCFFFSLLLSLNNCENSSGYAAGGFFMIVYCLQYGKRSILQVFRFRKNKKR